MKKTIFLLLSMFLLAVSPAAVAVDSDDFPSIEMNYDNSFDISPISVADEFTAVLPSAEVTATKDGPVTNAEKVINSEFRKPWRTVKVTDIYNLKRKVPIRSGRS